VKRSAYWLAFLAVGPSFSLSAAFAQRDRAMGQARSLLKLGSGQPMPQGCSEKRATIVIEDTPTPTPAAAVRFSVTVPCTQPGEVVFCVGAADALGWWDPTKAVKCSTTAETFPVWTSEVVPLTGHPDSLEFKLIIGREDRRGGWRWEEGANRIARLPAPRPGTSGKVIRLSCTFGSSALNFALKAPGATSAWLLLEVPPGHQDWGKMGATEGANRFLFRLDPKTNRTSSIWHVEVAASQIAFCPTGVRYAWQLDAVLDTNGMPRASNPWILDPFAREIESCTVGAWNDRGSCYAPMAVVPEMHADKIFDWQGVDRPGLHLKDLVIYEMHVRGFTRNPDSKLREGSRLAGTFLGVLEKIPHLLRLGINCIELLPIFEFDETANPNWNPQTGEQLCNYWGYSTVAFFVPMHRFVVGGQVSAATTEFKTMVRELHRAGIEVILDVVFNHTAEGVWGGDHWKSWSAIALSKYYLLSQGYHTNYTGCGNTMNANDPLCMDWILECVRFWALDMRVDGFRFDAAASLCRGSDGKVLLEPPLIKRLTNDPELRHVKFVAEPWDCSLDGHMLGRFPTGWAEWNGKFRETVRRFLKGDEGMKGDFATSMCGSSDIFGHRGRRPCHSINYVTTHDGFTLRDLVSYNGKHNACNGEDSRDGEDYNNSWNCGAEGFTADGKIKHLRECQMRNFLVAVLLSVGTPLLLFGDEYGRSQNGCNNGYCQDSLSWFSWAECDREERGLVRFTRLLIALRRRYAHIFCRTEFLSDSDVWWRVSDWKDPYNYICYVLHGYSATGYSGFLIAFNAGHEERVCDLPDGNTFLRLVDTSLQPPQDICGDEAQPVTIQSGTYGMAPRSCIVLQCMMDYTMFAA